MHTNGFFTQLGMWLLVWHCSGMYKPERGLSLGILDLAWGQMGSHVFGSHACKFLAARTLLSARNSLHDLRKLSADLCAMALLIKHGRSKNTR